MRVTSSELKGCVYLAAFAFAIKLAVGLWSIMGWLSLGIPAIFLVGSVYLDGRKATAMVRQVLREYDRIDDSAVVQWEQKFPHGEERHLIYALRVAKPGLRAKTLKTFLSRWSTVHGGAGGSGLNAGRASAAYEEVCTFLSKRFATTLDRLCRAEVDKAYEQSEKRKTANAKINALLKSRERLESALGDLHPRNDDLEAVFAKYIASLNATIRLQESD